MHSQPGWRDDYLKIVAQMVAEGATIDAIADQLDMAPDLVADLLDHPLAPILERWRATKPGCGWAALEHSNTL